MVLIRRWAFYLLVAIVLLSMAVQSWQLFKFVSAGPRFTAQQGQELCEAVRALAKESYGYRASGKPLLACDYLEWK